MSDVLAGIAAYNTFVGAMKTVKVGGLYSEQVGASRSITAVGAMTFTAGLSGKFQCAKNITVKARKNLALEGDENLATIEGGLHRTSSLGILDENFMVRSFIDKFPEPSADP